MNKYMEEAKKQAKLALENNEVPVGAVIVKDRNIISKAYNMKESLKDVTAHAEILAIRKASKKLDNWRLSDCEMYVTLEPCPMCASAIIQSRIKKIHIGTFDPNMGACGSVINIPQNNYLKSFVEINWIYDEECSNILSEFFGHKRR